MPAARVFYISLEFSNARRVLSQWLLYLLNKYLNYRNGGRWYRNFLERFPAKNLKIVEFPKCKTFIQPKIPPILGRRVKGT